MSNQMSLTSASKLVFGTVGTTAQVASNSIEVVGSLVEAARYKADAYLEEQKALSDLTKLKVQVTTEQRKAELAGEYKSAHTTLSKLGVEVGESGLFQLKAK